MSILNTPEIDALRIRVNAFTRRKELDSMRAGKSATHAPYFFRWLSFVQKIERLERAAVRFAVHTERVNHALETPVTNYVREILSLERFFAVVAEVA